LDGSVVEAAASRHRTLSLPQAREQRAKAEQALAEEYDSETAARWEQLQSAVEVLEARTAVRQQQYKNTSAVRVSLSDLEAYVQPDKTGKVCPSFRPAILAEQHRLIVGQDVHPSSEVEAAKKPLQDFQKLYGHKIELTLADTLFCNFESLNELSAASEEVLCPPKQPSRKPFRLPMLNGHFDKTAFHFDEETGEITCPQGRRMKQVGTRKVDGQQVTTYRGVGCGTCPSRKLCTEGKGGRSLKWYEVDTVKHAMRKQLREPEGKAAYARRAQLVELPLANLKQRFGCIRFARRGLRKVRMEFALWCLSYNLWQTMNLLARAA
jgi:hypothetical protein